MDFITEPLVRKLAKILNALNSKIVVAESCTGGKLAESITAQPGSSSFFDAGIISYSNDSKTNILGVELNNIKKYGAVSSEVAHSMAVGALRQSSARFAIAITGIAGPTGGTKAKPVGTVYFGFAYRINTLKNSLPASTQHAKKSPLLHLNELTILTSKQFFEGNRENIRKQAVKFALLKAERFFHSALISRMD